jgi:hypothetical protein
MCAFQLNWGKKVCLLFLRENSMNYGSSLSTQRKSSRHFSTHLKINRPLRFEPWLFLEWSDCQNATFFFWKEGPPVKILSNINRLSSIKTLKQPIKYLHLSFPIAEGLLWPGSIKCWLHNWKIFFLSFVPSWLSRVGQSFGQSNLAKAAT